MKPEKLILSEIEKALNVDYKKTEKLLKEISKAKKINVIGHGRSWHVGKAFSMRLKHLGFKTGRLKRDLTIVISGSGETKNILKIIRKRKRKIICITSNKSSSIAKKADLVIVLNAKETKQPLRSLFEQAALVYLDSVIIKLMKKLDIKEKEMWKRHD